MGLYRRVQRPTRYRGRYALQQTSLSTAKYTTGSSDNRGSYTVNIGAQVLKATVEPTRSDNQSTTVSLGQIKLAPGQYEIAVKPVEIKGGELMRLFNVALTPVSDML